ncbi:MAG: protein kinase [Polyangiales bacterium]
MGAAQPLRVIRDRYRLDAPIGEGGMAEVWRAWDLTLQRAVAVKLLFPNESHTEEAARDRFLREARIAASVQHRNVIHIVDFGTIAPEGQPYMVMELLQGETLAARLRRQRPLPVAEAVQIGHLTLRGLAAVHAAGIVHRDLKPENVYLKEEAGVVYPKILDFGISRSIGPANDNQVAGGTRDGVIVGTPEYMSPEQARGVKQLDYRTDLYSMGVVLYEALTGRLPFTAENVGDLIVKIVTGFAPPVHELVPQVPREISDVIKRAMERVPDQRFADATEMQEALLAASQAREPQSLPMFSDLPPNPTPSNPRPHVVRSSPRPANTLPRTQAVRVQMLAPAKPAPVVSMSTLPPSRAAFAAMSDRAGQLAREAARLQGSSEPPAADGGADLSSVTPLPTDHDGRADTIVHGDYTPPDYPLIQAAPPHDSVSDRGLPLTATGRSSLPTDYVSSAAPREIGPEPSGPPGVTLPRAWYLPGVAGIALLAAGSLALWISPSASAPPRRRSTTAQSKVVVAPPKPHVTLTLSGLPPEASVTLDGEPNGPVLDLPRSDQSHSVAVLSPGKQPWHVTFVPNADQTLNVQLLDAPPSPAPAVRPVKAVPPPGAAKPRPHRSQGPALREPDF